MTWLYLTGGRQRRDPLDKHEWQLYGRAVVLRVHTETGACEVCTEYVSPPEARPATGYSVLFRGGTIGDGSLFVCTPTEILGYDLSTFACTRYLSLPWFNDLHHVALSAQRTLLVASTGLDMVLETTLTGDVLRYWSVLSTDVWERFSRDADYRKVPTTKPHASHPNHVFLLDGEIWVTRFEQKDAISVTTPARRIPISVEKPHDGVVQGEKTYFTTVNGNIVVADRKTLQVVEIIDLNEISEASQPLGWCRGLFLDGEKAWVGFSRLRPTRFRQNLSWIKHGFKKVGKYGTMPTRLSCFDLKRKRLLGEVEVEGHGLNTIFGVL